MGRTAVSAIIVSSDWRSKLHLEHLFVPLQIKSLVSLWCADISVWMSPLQTALTSWHRGMQTVFSGLCALAWTWPQTFSVKHQADKHMSATHPSWEVWINLVFPDLSRKWAGSLDFTHYLLVFLAGGKDMINRTEGDHTLLFWHSHGGKKGFLAVVLKPQFLAGLTVITHCCLFCSPLITFLDSV